MSFGIPILSIVTVAILGYFVSTYVFPSESPPYMTPNLPSVWPINLITTELAHFLRKSAESMAPSPYKVLNDMYGVARVSIIYACMKLDLAEHLYLGPKTVDELSTLTNVSNPDSLQRLLRAAQSMGYFEEDLATKKWSNTRYSAVLHRKHPSSLHDLIGHWKEDTMESWGRLTDCIVHDNAVYREIHGREVWETFIAQPESGLQFQGAMDNFGHLNSAALADDYHWSKYNRVIDYGGSSGSFLSHILFRHTNIPAAAVFDQPQVISNTINTWKADEKLSSISSKVEFVGGSFFDLSTLPFFKNGDVIILRMILHDWDDEKSTEILNIIKQGILQSKATDVTLAIVEISLPEKDTISTRYVVDLLMKIIFNARERNHEQWKALLKQSGFELIKSTPTRSLYNVIEARLV